MVGTRGLWWEGFIAVDHRWRDIVATRQTIGQSRTICDRVGHQVNHPFLAFLYCPLDHHQSRRHHRPTLPFHIARPEQGVDDAGFILNRNEHSIPLAGTLAGQNNSHHTDLVTIGCGIGIGTAQLDLDLLRKSGGFLMRQEELHDAAETVHEGI